MCGAGLGGNPPGCWSCPRCASWRCAGLLLLSGGGRSCAHISPALWVGMHADGTRLLRAGGRAAAGEVQGAGPAQGALAGAEGCAGAEGAVDGALWRRQHLKSGARDLSLGVQVAGRDLKGWYSRSSTTTHCALVSGRWPAVTSAPIHTNLVRGLPFSQRMYISCGIGLARNGAPLSV